jgi:phage FluMu gp28-like protein
VSTKLKRKLKKAAVVTTMLVTAAAQAAGLTGAAKVISGLVHYRKYQQPVFWDSETKTAIIHWSRQIGKSYTLAGWAVKRLLDRPGRLVTVLSNSRDNGAEFVVKCHEIVEKLKEAMKIEEFQIESNADELNANTSLSEDVKYELMRFEVRITVGGKTGRIKVLAANPRTARGFSGDLILDEFAFHENSAAIWEAAEPIISSNPDFLCRISSTGNGRHNMFYQLIADGLIPYYRVRRSDAWATGELKIFSIINNKEITPDEARAQAADKRAYDQNYECAFNDEASALLTQDLINAAQREGVVVEEQEWSEATIKRLREQPIGDLYLGQDVGRKRDLSVQAVIEKNGSKRDVVAMLRMENMRLPAQQRELDKIVTLPKFRRSCIDMTGLGTGLVEYAQEDHGGKIIGINFATTVPITQRLKKEGRKKETARVTEVMATNLLGVFEDGAITIPQDGQLRDDLRKPERLVSPGGNVSIAAVRDEAGHADHFWALALAEHAIGQKGTWAAEPVKVRGTHAVRSMRMRERRRGLAA